MKERMLSCAACGAGVMLSTNLRGRPFDYRDQQALVFDQDLVVRACSNPSCGDLRLGGARTQRFSDVLERLRLERKRNAAIHFVETAEREFPDVSRASWEEMLGISKGYLSRVSAGKRLPDTPLELLLEAFARRPQAVLSILKMANRLPPAIEQQLVDRHGPAWQTAS